ncbi:hypothetical protein Tco_0998015 [Tanacetum coccineum]
MERRMMKIQEKIMKVLIKRRKICLINTNNVNAASTNEVNVVGGKTSIKLPDDPNMHALEDYSIFDFIRNDEEDDVEADMNNLDTTIQVSPNPTTRIHKENNLFTVVDQCKKQIVVANSIIEAEYVAASSCCGQVLWIQNQLLDYGATTTATSLDAEQDRGGGPRCQETMGDIIAQTKFKNISKTSNDPLLARGNTLRSGEDRLKLEELMALCTNLQQRVLDLETTKTTPANRELQFIEMSNCASKLQQQTTATITDVEVTLAQALAELKSAKPKAVKVVIEEIEQELAFKLQAEEEEEEERLAREKAQQVEEANIAWDDVQAKIDADYQLAQRLQAQEQDELTDEEKARLFVQFLEQRRKHFAAKRAEEKRNRPPTRAQQRSIMCTYLKNMEGWKPKSLKNKSFANIQELFDKAMKRVNTFVDYRTKLVEEREELEQESSKKQKLEEDKESEELKQCLEIIPDDVTIDATPLSTKSPTIVDYKIYKEGKKSYFQIIRADGKTQMYLTFGKMLKNFDREDLEVLWSIVKARFKKTEPVNYMDNFLLLNLKTMFEHHVEDNVWKNQQGLVKVLNWNLYDSCGVHCVTMQNMLFYLLVEKMYPLTNHTLDQMFNDVKLQVDYECEIAFELLRLVKKLIKEGYVPK